MCPGNAIILQLLTKRMNKVYYFCISNLYEVQLPKNKHFKQYIGLELRIYVPKHTCPLWCHLAKTKLLVLNAKDHPECKHISLPLRVER